MIGWRCLLLSVVLQLTSAQAIPYGVPNRSIGNTRIPNGMPIGRGVPNGMANNAVRTSLPNGMANNAIRRNMPIAANNMGKGLFLNRQTYANAHYANNYLPNKANNNMVKASLANMRQNIVEPTFATPVMPEIKATTVENLANANVVPSGMTGMPKVANLNFGSNPIPVTVTSGNHGNLPVGLNILADNLEVRGSVAVTGRMPIYGTVTLNGSVPNEGKASVDYSCGAPAI